MIKNWMRKFVKFYSRPLIILIYLNVPLALNRVIYKLLKQNCTTIVCTVNEEYCSCNFILRTFSIALS